MRRLALAPAFFLAVLAAAIAGDAPAGAPAPAPARTIAYHGYLPYCSGDNGPTGDFEIEFLLYETPQKGVVRWREKQKARVEAEVSTLPAFLQLAVKKAPSVEDAVEILDTYKAESAAAAAQAASAAPKPLPTKANPTAAPAATPPTPIDIDRLWPDNGITEIRLTAYLPRAGR